MMTTIKGITQKFISVISKVTNGWPDSLGACIFLKAVKCTRTAMWKGSRTLYCNLLSNVI